MERAEPVDWQSVSNHVTDVLEAHQKWYEGVPIRMLEKEWIDVPGQSPPHAPAPQSFINALAYDLYDGISEAEIPVEQRNCWRTNLTSILDQSLLPACVWYMEQLEEDHPHSPEDWVNYVAAQQEVSSKDADRAKELLLAAIDYLQRNGFIVEINRTPVYTNDTMSEEMLDAMAGEIDELIKIVNGEIWFVPGENGEQIESVLERYRQELARGEHVETRTMQIELLERVRDGRSTAWSEVYESVKDVLDANRIDKERAKGRYLDAIDFFERRKLITKKEKE